MHIHPLLESLASLDTACWEAVECLNVLAYHNYGPEFGNLEKLQILFGGDGCSGQRQTIQQSYGTLDVFVIEPFDAVVHPLRKRLQ